MRLALAAALLGVTSLSIGEHYLRDYLQKRWRDSRPHNNGGDLPTRSADP